MDDNPGRGCPSLSPMGSEMLEDLVLGYLAPVEEFRLWRHADNCSVCARKLAALTKFLEKTEAEPWLTPAEARWLLRQTALKVRLRKDLDRALQGAKGLVDRVRSLVDQTFAFPFPAFPAVFGESDEGRLLALGPFGKVRFPILFHWRGHSPGDHEVSIEDENETVLWTHRTSGATAVIKEGEVDLKPGAEYSWTLKSLSEGEDGRRLLAFFTLATREEEATLRDTEARLEGLDFENDVERHVLWGGILEGMGFFIEAVDHYQAAYAMDPLPGIAYRIVGCYDALELEDLREEWNARIRFDRTVDAGSMKD